MCAIGGSHAVAECGTMEQFQRMILFKSILEYTIVIDHC
jgi:hypothetical protein